MYRYLTFCCTCRPHVLNCFQPWGTWVSGIYFRYCFDDLFPPVIIVFVPVLPETACLSPWFIVYLLPCTSCQIAVHRIPCYRVLYFPVLPPARINHGIWANHLTESFNARRSAIDTFLFRIVPCNDLLSFISDYKRPDGKCRILSCQNFWHEGFCWPIRDYYSRFVSPDYKSMLSGFNRKSKTLITNTPSSL